MKPTPLKYVFDGNDVDKWKYCPKCGSEILEIYPGDYFGHITCFKDNESCDIDFTIWAEGKDGNLWR